jgi:hypothetical protein
MTTRSVESRRASSRMISLTGRPPAFEQTDLNHGPVPVEMSRDINLGLGLAARAVTFRVDKKNGCACGVFDEWRRFGHRAGRLASVAPRKCCTTQ